MALSPSEISRCVWAETKAFGPSGPANLTNVRRLIARLAAATDGAGMQREALPSGSDPTWAGTVQEIIALAKDAASAGPNEERVLIWPSTDGSHPSVDPPPPPPWRDAQMPAPMGPFTLTDGRQVMVFRRPAVANDGTTFASIIGLWRRGELGRVRPQPDKRWGRGLAVVALALFLLGCFGAYELGVGAHEIILRFATTATLSAAGDAQPGLAACNVQPSANTPVAVPADWRRADGKDASDKPVKSCLTLWREASKSFVEDKSHGYFARTAIGWFQDSRGTISNFWPFLIIEVALAIMFVAAGYGIMGRPLGAIVDDRYRMSLTLGQLCLWSILLFAGLAALGLYNIGFGGQIYAELQKLAALPAPAGQDQPDWGKIASSYNFFPQMMAPFLTLLGFAAGSPAISALILRSKTTADTEKAITAQQPATGGASTVAPYLDKNRSPSEAALGDLVVKEVAGQEDLVDVTRLQHVAITALLVVGYGFLLIEAVSAIEPLAIAKALVARAPLYQAMPPVDSTFLTLLGISHAALLGGKYFDRQTAAPAPAGGGQG